MLYCEQCEALYEGEKCPLCGNHHGREPRDGDPCFLREKGQIEIDMLADILKQNGIPSMVKSRSGAALAMYTGWMLEKFRLFVPYGLYEQAEELTHALENADLLGEETETDEQEETEEEGEEE